VQSTFTIFSQSLPSSLQWRGRPPRVVEKLKELTWAGGERFENDSLANLFSAGVRELSFVLPTWQLPLVLLIFF
jgi:hypothetical protein